MPLAFGVELIVLHDELARLLRHREVYGVVLAVVVGRSAVRRHSAFVLCLEVAEVARRCCVERHVAELFAGCRVFVGVVHVAPEVAAGCTRCCLQRTEEVGTGLRSLCFCLCRYRKSRHSQCYGSYRRGNRTSVSSVHNIVFDVSCYVFDCYK